MSKVELYELTILMPCLNEEKTLLECILKAKKFINSRNISGEILISDNGSADNSVNIAKKNNVRVISTSSRGYGSALINGIKSAKGKYIIMGDADCSYDFSSLDNFLEKLRGGSDLVMGNRFKGKIFPNAMPFLHKYLGNPILSFFGRLFFRSKISDFHCGLRGFSKKSIKTLNLKCKGMEFASEMVAKAELKKFKISEVPINLYPDKRSRRPHLRTWLDGWRHLKFLLIFSPKWLFLMPGLFLLITGLIGFAFLISGPIDLVNGRITLHSNSFLVFCVMIIVGVQSLTFYNLMLSIRTQMFPETWGEKNNIFSSKKFEPALFFSLFLLSLGIVGIFYTINIWESKSFGDLDFHQISRILYPSITSITCGIQIFLSLFVYAAISHINQD